MINYHLTSASPPAQKSRFRGIHFHAKKEENRGIILANNGSFFRGKEGKVCKKRTFFKPSTLSMSENQS